MIRLFIALLLCLTVLPTAAQPFRADIDRWVAQDKLSPPPQGDLLFVGSSSIRRWEHLARDFPEYDVVQRGFGGSTFADVLRYFDEIVLASHPRLIVVFEGTNDIAGGKSVEETFADYLTFTQRIHAELPKTKILFIGITPTPMRWEKYQEKSTELGQRVIEHCKNDPRLGYIDTPAPFLARGAPDGEAFTSLFCDRLHLTEEGYDLWSEVIGKAVREAAPPIKKFVLNPRTLQPGDQLRIDFGTNLSLFDSNSKPIWNRWHSNEEASVLAGEHSAELLDVMGQPTGISLTITGGFYSKNAPDKENTFYAEFILDWFESNEYDSPGGFLIKGLDPALTYRLDFCPKKNKTSKYIVTGLSASTAKSKVGSGGVAIVSKIRPNKWGHFFVDVCPKKGSQAYLSVMTLGVLEPEEAKEGQDQQD